MTFLLSVEGQVQMLQEDNINNFNPIISNVSNAEYSRAQQILKPIKRIHVTEGIYYEIEGLENKERIFFKCLHSGWVTIKYKCINEKDVFAFKGKGILQIEENMTRFMDSPDYEVVNG